MKSLKKLIFIILIKIMIIVKPALAFYGSVSENNGAFDLIVGLIVFIIFLIVLSHRDK